jgi:aerobic carbon-monoxide dehydrogenase small subunit
VRPIELTLNGARVRTTVEPQETLLWVLRQRLSATEVKSGCERGDCGACAVLLDGRAINSCLALAVQADGRQVTTVRGLGTPEAPHPLQTAFIELGAAQCGICIPGMLVTLYAVLAARPDSSRREIREAIGGNLCRCTGYHKIVDAAEAAARRLLEPPAPAAATGRHRAKPVRSGPSDQPPRGPR